VNSIVPRLDTELIRKYDRPGPRYTSYPPSPSFHEGFAEKEYRQALAGQKPAYLSSNNSNLSLYFHIPFCDTLCYFCGCSMIVSRNRERINRYLGYLEREIDLVASGIDSSRQLEQLHWGGGTPTHLNPTEIVELGTRIRHRYNWAQNAEASCEIDPRELTREHLEALREVGFGRISLGLQDLNPAVQKAVNREQSLELTASVIQQARELEFGSINLDLIYGLPLQTVDGFAETLDQVLKLRPDRLALFNFAYLPAMFKHHQVIRQEDLPPPDDKLLILTNSVRRLLEEGYRFIGMDHFAREDDSLARAQDRGELYRNFQGYSTHKGLDVVAHGITGIGQVGRTYSQNFRTEKEYFEALDQNRLPVFRGFELSQDDEIRRFVITEIMCNFHLDYSKFKEVTGYEFQDYFHSELDDRETGSLGDAAADGLISLSPDGIQVLSAGQFLLRNIAMCFDAHRKSPSKTGFSRTI
jgi:oxygen-independent coproporphyrinogen-3 oxidase